MRSKFRRRNWGFLNPTSQICFGPNKRLIVSVGVQLPLIQPCTPWPIGFLKKWFCGKNSISGLPSFHWLTEHMLMHYLPKTQSQKTFHAFQYHLAILKETLEVWQLDFVHMPPSQRCKRVLVIVPHWVEAVLWKRATCIVGKSLFKRINLIWRIPSELHRDKEIYFVR